METERLSELLEKYNKAYRDGAPLITDAEYDQLVEQLKEIDPYHPFLHRVEPENFLGRKEVRHPVPMLSLEKAYTDLQLSRFISRIEKEAVRIGLTNLLYRVTPKLDGLAGRDDGSSFTSRGNGFVGYEISGAFEKGVIPIGGRGRGLGEIVVVKSYFELHLAEKFEHPRNMVIGIVSSDVLNENARQALLDGQVHFVPYEQLPYWEGSGVILLKEIDEIIQNIQAETDYPMDGVVAEIVDPRLREIMGATTHHHRWQIAVKRRGDSAQTVVEDIQWQVGRTGNVTPVLLVAPVNLSGATIRRVTAHHAGMVSRLMIGPGARIEIIRSGEVIPKLERVISSAKGINVPERCPSCEHDLYRQGDFLRCINNACPAQIVQRLCHWFRTIGNADWFGIKTIQKLVSRGYDTLEKIYRMSVKEFIQLGFGPVQSDNLFESLKISRLKAVEDWRFLAALGIPDLGVGDSRRLLQYFSIDELTDLTAEKIAAIEGFGGITSQSIANGIFQIKETLLFLLNLGFNLERMKKPLEFATVNSPIFGMNIVFTGTMREGNREEMEHQARSLGAKVLTSVSKHTQLLVCGEKVGGKKIDAASRLGIKIISESEYVALISSNTA